MLPGHIKYSSAYQGHVPHDELMNEEQSKRFRHKSLFMQAYKCHNTTALSKQKSSSPIGSGPILHPYENTILMCNKSLSSGKWHPEA